jgi:site-specific recombinase XerD
VWDFIPVLLLSSLTIAINFCCVGVDVFSLQKLMGHADLQVLRRYLAQTTEDIAQEHRIGSPEDNAGF